MEANTLPLYLLTNPSTDQPMLQHMAGAMLSDIRTIFLGSSSGIARLNSAQGPASKVLPFDTYVVPKTAIFGRNTLVNICFLKV